MEGKIKKILLWLLDLGINIAIIFVLVIVIQKWIIAPFDVSGSSMCDTLNLLDGECHTGYGEKIIINEATYVFGEIARGDVIVFKAPSSEDDKYFIKRVIGLPGDKVEIKEGEVHINDEKLIEDYLNADNKSQTKIYFSGFSVFDVPEDSYFVLGDNRKASTDSRSCFQNSLSVECQGNLEKAYVKKEDIRGKAWFVWWPPSSIRLIDHPDYPELESLAEK